MKLIAVATAIVATANSLATGNATCCFTLTASGGKSGPVGQIDDGQTRIGNGTQPGQFCVDSSGAIVDGKGRGCFLTRMFVSLYFLLLHSPFYVREIC
jgi:hypothetical protein